MCWKVGRFTWLVRAVMKLGVTRDIIIPWGQERDSCKRAAEMCRDLSGACRSGDVWRPKFASFGEDTHCKRVSIPSDKGAVDISHLVHVCVIEMME